MSKNIKGLIVTFENDLRDEHADSIINAIQIIKGIAKAAPIESNYDDIMNREQIKTELRKKLFEIV